MADGIAAPTSAEIEAALAGIEQDGPMARLTIDLGVLMLKDPLFSDANARMARVLIGMVADTPAELLESCVSAALAGALMMGLNYGLRIGHARAACHAEERNG